ncbi:hypothetical protein LguiA_009429 [Lonicera macranthoides]
MQDSIDGPIVARAGQSIYMSVYQTKLADLSRLITITWCKNLLLHGLSVSVQHLGEQSGYTCKVELKPWYFWRKHGSKQFVLDTKPIDIFWDLRAAKFNGETEPTSDYYVAIVCDQEVVLLVGDLKKDAYRRTGCRPALMDPILVSRKEHIFGKKRFSTRVRFHEKGGLHEVSVECKNRSKSGEINPEMEIRIDGHLVIHVNHLQWKFRGNESIHLNKVRVEVCWDVHDWLFSPGLRHALFIIKPSLLATCSSSLSSPSPLSSSLSSTPLSSGTESSGGSVEGFNANGTEFCLFLYAWRIE